MNRLTSRLAALLLMCALAGTSTGCGGVLVANNAVFTLYDVTKYSNGKRPSKGMAVLELLTTTLGTAGYLGSEPDGAGEIAFISLWSLTLALHAVFQLGRREERVGSAGGDDQPDARLAQRDGYPARPVRPAIVPTDTGATDTGDTADDPAGPAVVPVPPMRLRPSEPDAAPEPPVAPAEEPTPDSVADPVPDPAREPVKTRPVSGLAAIGADELFAALDEDAAAADAKYRGKRLRVSGVIERLDRGRDHAQFPYVTLEGKHPVRALQCFFQDGGALQGLRQGMRMTVEGVYVRSAVNVILNRCEVGLTAEGPIR